MKIIAHFRKSKLFLGSRFVYRDAPAEGPSDEPDTQAQAVEAPPVIGVQADIAELHEDTLAQLDAMGEAKDYVDVFNDARKIVDLRKFIAVGKLIPVAQTKADFENWPKIAQEYPDDFLKMLKDLPLPHGKGKDAFLRGFDSTSPDFSTMHKASLETLPKIITILSADSDENRSMTVSVNEAAKTNPLLGTTLTEIKETFKKNYERAGGWEKGAMIGSAALLLWYAWSKRNEDVPGIDGLKWSTVFKGLGGFMAVNYLWSKGSKSGRSLTQQGLDVLPSVDNIKEDDNPVRGFAENHGMQENEEKFRTLMLLKDSNIKVLYSAYKEEKLHGDRNRIRSIPPETLGLKKNVFDGELAYDIVDDLVRDTAINEATKNVYDKVQFAQEAGNEYTPPSDQQIVEQATQPHALLKTFERKYVNGDNTLSNSEVSLQEAINNEYPPDIAKRIITMHAENRVMPSSATEIKRRAKKWWNEGRQEYEKHMAEKVNEGIRLAKASGVWAAERYGILKNRYVIPAGERAIGLWRRHVSIPVGEFINKQRSRLQQSELDPILPTEFAPKVTSPGVVTILGYPGLPFETTTNTDGKKVLIIDGSKEIIVDNGPTDPDNEAIFSGIETKIKDRVKNLIAKDISKNGAVRLQGKDVEWDPGDKKWMIRDVHFAQHAVLPGLGNKKNDLSVEVDPNASKVKYYIDGHEVKNFSKLDEEYAQAKIENIIWNDPNRQQTSKFLKGLPVEVNKIEDTPNGKRIRGTIGGLQFNATPKDPTDFNKGLDFVDPSNGVGGYEKLPITLATGGNEFLARLVDQIDESDYVKDAFEALEGAMDNADEGILQRLSAASSTTKIWILPIPTEPDKIINGNILHNQWKHTLHFKRVETMNLFEQELRKKGRPRTVEDIEKAYKETVEDSVEHIKKLQTWITTLSPENKSKQFIALLSSERDPSSGMPAGLEYVNYQDKKYGELFKDYKKMIEQFDFAGLDRSDIPGFSGSYYEAYTGLLRVWSHYTRKYRNGPVTPAKELDIRTLVIDEVRKKLGAATLNGKKIKATDVPRSDEEVAKWLPNKVS